MAALAMWLLSTLFGNGPASWFDRSAASHAAFEEATGVRIERVAISGGGGLVDVQYQVVNPDKAQIVHDDENPLTIVDQRTGRALYLPFHDHESSRELQPARHYRQLIVNGGGVLARGKRVTVSVGDARLENLIVQ
jgi:hypothetical protein